VTAENSGEIHRYILKPWDIEALRAELRDALKLHGQRRAELELLAARRETVAALAAHMAHELATPLATIASAAEALGKHLPALVDAYRRSEPPPRAIPEPVLQALALAPAVALESANRSRLLIGLLLMNLSSGNAQSAFCRRVTMGSLIEEALGSYPFASGERESVRVEGDDFELTGSPTLLVHVIFNLLKNALDALHGGGKGEIRLYCEPGTPWNRMTVEDTGCGIPQEIMPHIFDELISLKGPGHGMGLPFCRRVMRGLGGEIVCRSRMGEYTRVELRFPCVDDAADSED
jgi:two-component system CAI-1 autoinducer sensor kinase/phosphatase CqsS